MRSNSTPQRGFSLVELLMALVLSSIFLASVTSEFLFSSRRTYDQRLIAETQDLTRALLDMLVFDLRMTGAGMPLSQSEFSDIGVGVGAQSLPILLNSTSSHITIRLNENGHSTLLTAAYVPSGFNLSFSVLSVAEFAEDDIIYLSNLYNGRSGALVGSIGQITGQTITLNSGYAASTGVSFASGATVHKVRTVSLQSPNDLSGITRDNGSGPIVLAPRSTFSITYLNQTGTAMALPLTQVAVVNDLTGLRVDVSVTSKAPLEDGTNYTAQASQFVALNNLIFNQ